MTKKYYAYVVPRERAQGVTDDWAKCEKIIRGKSGARVKAFMTREEAEQWLRLGAQYSVRRVKKLSKGVYFDAGTGRGKGVEVSVTDEEGKNLLHTALSKKQLNAFGKLVLRGKASVNFGELLACKYALEIAFREGIRRVFGDSRLVLAYWSRGFAKKETLPQRVLDEICDVTRLRKEFEARGGKVEYIRGDDNPADLGFHRS